MNTRENGSSFAFIQLHRRRAIRLASLGLLLSLLLLAFGCGNFDSFTSPQTSNQASCIAEFTGQAGGTQLGVGDESLGGHAVAQSFQAAMDGEVSRAQLRLILLGNKLIEDDDTLILSILDDQGDEPGVLLAASAPVPVTRIGSDASRFYIFTFQKSVSLRTGGRYWLKLWASYPLSSTDLVQWLGNDGTPPDYTDGAAKYEGGDGTWLIDPSKVKLDLNFKVGC